MSRNSKSRRSARPSGPRSPTQNATLAAVELFNAAVTQAALDSGGAATIPFAHVQQIVPGANFHGKPNTVESAKRLADMKRGVDPALNRRFETATEARAYRKRTGVDVMSPSEFAAEMSGKGSSIATPAWLKDTGNVDPDTGRVVKEFRGAAAFRDGERIMREQAMGSF